MNNNNNTTINTTTTNTTTIKTTTINNAKIFLTPTILLSELIVRSDVARRICAWATAKIAAR